MINLDDLSGFDWDAGNLEKNELKHGVSAGECEEVFFNLPLLLRGDPAHSRSEPRWFVLGKTSAGRTLFIVFTLRQDKIRGISARDMSEKERKRYEQANS